MKVRRVASDMLAAIALGILGQTITFKPNAVVGTPYLLGSKRYVSASKEIIDIGTEMWATVHSARSTLYFPTKSQDYVAQEGQKLFLIDATIKNPSKVAYPLGPSGPFRVRVNDPNAKSEDYYVMGAVRKDLETLQGSLKKNDSVDLTLILRAPAAVPTCRVGIYFHNERQNIRWYDLTDKVKKSSSVYCTGGFVYSQTATIKLGDSADFDWLTVKPLGLRTIGTNEYACDVEVTNPGFKPGRWGWQYATATLSAESGADTNFYPQLYDKEGKMWSEDIAPGKSSVVEYRFFPGREIKPKLITFKSVTSKRILQVKLP